MARAKDHNQIYLQIAALRDERNELAPIVDAIPEVRRLRALDDAIVALEKLAEATRQRTGSKIVTAPKDSEYARLSLPKAAVKYLEHIREPQTPEQIWEVLSASGVTVRARRPIHAVHKALEKHMPRNRWLQFVDGKWSLKSPDPAKGGITDGDLKKHGRATSDGIAHFKTRTGSTWGRKPVITAAQIEKFRELYDTGNYTVAAASREAKVSNAYFYMHREAMLAWKKGDPWPLPQKSNTPVAVSGDVIPMRVVGEDK
jgi:hypothetical protein